MNKKTSKQVALLFLSLLVVTILFGKSVYDTVFPQEKNILWDMEPKILLNKPAPGAWWLVGYTDGEPSPDVQSPSSRLLRALEREESVVVENFCQIYVNDYNNTIFVVTKSLDTKITDAFLDIIKPSSEVSVKFRQGYASRIELEAWEAEIGNEIENIEANGVDVCCFGKTVNATLKIGIINISMDDIEIILELLDGKVPPGVLVFEPGSKASIPRPPRPSVLRIGAIAPTKADIPRYEFLLNLAEDDLIYYLKKSNIDIPFDFYIDSSEGQALIALHHVQYFKSMDVNFVIFGGSTSQLDVIDAYANDNDILVVSTVTNIPIQSLQADDYIFKLSPDSTMNSKTVSKIALESGIRSMIVLENENTWAEYIGDQFIQDFSGEVLTRIKYPSNTDDYTDVLIEAESIIEQALINSSIDELGVFWIESSSDCRLLEALESYPLLSNITWFSTEAICNSDIILRIEPSIASRIKLISPKLVPVWNNDTTRISEAYQSHFNDSFDFYDAVIYDSYMTVWLSMIERESDNPYRIREFFPQIAGNFTGLTGPCELDNYGDRLNYLVELYAITDPENPRWGSFGYYHAPEDFVVIE